MAKVSYLKRQLAYELSNNHGMKYKNISKVLGIEYSNTAYHTKKGFKTYKEFESYVDKKNKVNQYSDKPVGMSKVHPLKKQVIYELRNSNYSIKRLSDITCTTTSNVGRYLKIGFENYEEFLEFSNKKKVKEMNPKEYEKLRLIKKGYDPEEIKREKEKRRLERNIRQMKKCHDFSRYLNLQLEKKNLNQTTLAKKTNVTRQTITNYCLAKNTPSKENLERILSTLNADECTKQFFIKRIIEE